MAHPRLAVSTLTLHTRTSFSHGYKQCRSDPNVFTKSDDFGTVTIALTIDDFLLSTSSDAAYRELVRVLSLKYQIRFALCVEL